MLLLLLLVGYEILGLIWGGAEKTPPTSFLFLRTCGTARSAVGFGHFVAVLRDGTLSLEKEDAEHPEVGRAPAHLQYKCLEGLTVLSGEEGHEEELGEEELHNLRSTFEHNLQVRNNIAADKQLHRVLGAQVGGPRGVSGMQADAERSEHVDVVGWSRHAISRTHAKPPSDLRGCDSARDYTLGQILAVRLLIVVAGAVKVLPNVLLAFVERVQLFIALLGAAQAPLTGSTGVRKLRPAARAWGARIWVERTNSRARRRVNTVLCRRWLVLRDSQEL
mmetsp:Transcript_25888/g.61575  ORF Transcript_25888/g.61575 Transcript_25888/m.61575 type:complete len:277 (+) Transcript_25888:351-1181(+)